MKWWSKFWKLRKQDDRVKMICLFCLAGCFFLGSVLYTGIGLYQSVNAPAEYILSVSSETGVTDTQLKEVKGLEGVSAVGRQIETNVMLNVDGSEVSFPCLKLSKEYMEKCYGAEDTGAMKKFYLNEAAVKQLSAALGEAAVSDFSDMNTEYQVSSVEGTPESGSAKLEVLKSGVKAEQPYLYCTADSAELMGMAAMLRVQTTDQDMDGQQLAEFQQMGFQVVNESQRKQEMIRQEMELLRLRYHVITAIVCFVAAECLRKWRR